MYLSLSLSIYIYIHTSHIYICARRGRAGDRSQEAHGVFPAAKILGRVDEPLSGAADYTPELAKARFDWKVRMPLNIHWTVPVNIHWESDNPCENTTDK